MRLWLGARYHRQMAEPRWHWVLLVGEHGGHGWFSGAAVRGTSLGDIIERAIAGQQHIDERDTAGFPHLVHEITGVPDGLIEVERDEIYVSDEVNMWELSEDEHVFVFPRGVVWSGDDGGFDIDEIAEGCVLWEGEDLFGVQAVVDGRRTTSVMYQLIERLPIVTSVGVLLHSHFDDAGVTEAWVSGRNAGMEGAMRVLIDHAADIVDNGGVELAVQIPGDGGWSTLSLCDHKLIHLQTPYPALREQVVDDLSELGIEPSTTGLRSLADDTDHHHYRPAGSRDRAGVCELLASLGWTRRATRRG